MNIRILSLLIVLLNALLAHANTASVGYCNGIASKSGSFSVEGNCDVSGAILLSKSMLAPYEGCAITAFRAALASKVNVDKVTLWLRKSLDGENIAETEITSKTDPALVKGWMETALPDNILIHADEELYLGMTYHQKAATKAFSLVGTGYENCFFADIADGNGWTDRHSEGILSIEAVVEGDFAVGYDLALISASADLSADPESINVTVTVANNGQNPISGFTLNAVYQDGASYPADFTSDLPSGENMKVSVNVPRNGDIFTNPLFMELGALADGDDVISENNRIRVEIPAVKKVFVEEYTTERCSNCPRVARYLHEVCEEEPYRDRIVVVCHHSGYHTDWLTQPIDEEFVKFFRIGFAPAVSYDRYPYFGNEIVNCPEKSDLRKTFDAALSKTPGVKIAVTPAFDASARKAVVTVNLERTTLNIADPHLTVFLTEDNITPVRQSGDSDGSHIHSHVIRAYNSTWGDPVNWTGSNCSMTYEFDIEEDWKTEDLNIVAVIGNVNPEDRFDNVIDNAEEVSLISSGASVAEIGDEVSVVRTDYYDIHGYKAAPDAPGLKIAVKTLSDGSLVTEKILRKN